MKREHGAISVCESEGPLFLFDPAGPFTRDAQRSEHATEAAAFNDCLQSGVEPLVARNSQNAVTEFDTRQFVEQPRARRQKAVLLWMDLVGWILKVGSLFQEVRGRLNSSAGIIGNEAPVERNLEMESLPEFRMKCPIEDISGRFVAPLGLAQSPFGTGGVAGCGEVERGPVTAWPPPTVPLNRGRKRGPGNSSIESVPV